MGGKNSVSYTGPKKSLVIVGGSFAGKAIVEQILTLDPREQIAEITIIDQYPYFEFFCNIFESVADPEAFVKSTVPFSEMYGNLKTNRIKFIQGRLININETENQIEVQAADESTSTLSFDALVICTGTTKGTPWYSSEEEGIVSLNERDQMLRDMYNNIKEAKNILLVGGGANGIEMAGYIKDSYPDKSVTVCQRGSKLSPQMPGAHEIVLEIFNEKDIKFLPNTTYHPEDPKL